MGFSLAQGRGRDAVQPRMNVTPLVDVVLVLLIIFMVVTPLLAKQVPLALPKKDDAQADAPDDAAIPNDDAANRRVRPDIAQAPRSKAQGVGHMGVICRLAAHSSDLSAGRNSLTKPSKSSAVWKFL